MTEITRVPLPPVAKGALGRLWIATILAVALGGAAAYGTREQGLEFDTVKPGSGPSPIASDYVLIKYVGKLASGKVFDSNDHAGLAVQGVIPGFSSALQRMQKGGKYHVVIPARLGYGARAQRDQAGEVSIPANSDLTFDIELLDMKSGEEVMRQQMIMQQMQQQMRGGAPGGALPGGAAPGGAAPGGAMPGGAAPGGTMPGGAPDGNPAH